MKKFVEWLAEQGWEIFPKSKNPQSRYRADWTAEKNGERLLIRDTDEEQPEVLLWCLKELGRRGLHWLLAHLEDNEYQLLAVNQFSSRSSANGSGSTMTQAAIAALTGVGK